jgi:flagellar biosynthesis protein FlhG
VHFNTLDFFGISDQGVVITAPEPGAVMNAYSFVKGALFRKMQNVFKNHQEVAALIDAETRSGEGENRFTLDWFKDALMRAAPDLLPIIGEIETSFTPKLVINRAPEGQTHLLVKNLISLCTEKLGIKLDHVGDLPDVREISNHLLNVPRFFDLSAGESYFRATQEIVRRLIEGTSQESDKKVGIFYFSDEEQDEIMQFIDTLDSRVFDKTNRNAWKLRMFFKPSDVVGYLISRGVTHNLFYKSS